MTKTETRFFEFRQNNSGGRWVGPKTVFVEALSEGGDDFFVAIPERFPMDKLASLVEAVRSKVEWDTNYSRSHVINWEVVGDDFVTDDVKNQLEWEGRVSFPTKVLVA